MKNTTDKPQLFTSNGRILVEMVMPPNSPIRVFKPLENVTDRDNGRLVLMEDEPRASE